MSLQVWLPLNGDLRNQGLYNTTFTNHSATINNSGKIGKCYSFNGSSNYLIANFTPGTIVPNEMSFCCWMKLNAIDVNQTLFCSRTKTGAGLSFFIISNQLRFDNMGNTKSDTYQTTFNYTFSANQWYHIAAVQTSTHKKLYINGVLQQTVAKTPGSGTNTSSSNSATKATIGASGANNASGNYLNGYLNDVRIYNHALSDKEVEEISKGLILHYPLNNIVNPNLLKNNPRSVTPTEYRGYQLNLTEKLELNQTYILQLWDINLSHTGKTSSQLKLGIYLGGAYNYLTEIAIPTGHLDYKKIAFKPTSWSRETEATNLYLNIYNSPSSASGTKNMSIGKWKLEKGSIPTRLISEGNIIYDCSGYNNNGIITGSLNIASSSSRYDYCTYTSSGDTNYITTPILYLPGDQITMNFWFKSLNTMPGNSYHMPLEGWASSNQSYEMSIYKTGYLRGGLVINGSRQVQNCTSTKLLDGNWHMCTMTYDGSIIKRYVDAVMEKSTSVTGSLITSSAFVLGHYGSNTTYYSKEAYTSDARIYTTALTEAQVKELYLQSKIVDE